jgi:hypothetical protein
MHAQVTPEDSRLLHSIPPARVALIDFALAKIPRDPLILDAATLANLREAY